MIVSVSQTRVVKLQVQSSDLVDIFADGKVFVSDFNVDSIPSMLHNAWELFKANADSLTDCFNPVYDLFAGYVMVGSFIVKKWVKSELFIFPEEFLKR